MVLNTCRLYSGLLSVGALLTAFGCGDGMDVLGPPDDSLVESTEQAVVVPRDIKLTKIGSHATGLFNQAGAEIAAYDPASKRLFSVSSASGRINVHRPDLSERAGPGGRAGHRRQPQQRGGARGRGGGGVRGRQPHRSRGAGVLRCRHRARC